MTMHDMPRDDLTEAKAQGLKRLTDALAEEMGVTGYTRDGLAWIIEATLYELAHLIRSGQPITVPSLGTFTRQVGEDVGTYSTSEAAELLCVQSNTMRMGLCRDGNYLGIIPKKMSNRRLLWPRSHVDALARGQAINRYVVAYQPDPLLLEDAL